MKQTSTLFEPTRRRFLAVLAAIGSLFSWPVIGKADSKLSKKEASFYRK